MDIHLFRTDYQEDVINMMMGHPLQFPTFIIERYPIRWKDSLRSAKGKKSLFYVAINDNHEIVGHAGYLFNSEVGLYEIVGVVVKKGFQRHGIGKALIDSVCNSVRELNENKLILYTLGHPGNEDTITFYQSIGFDLIQYEEDFFQAGYGRVTFTKSLIT